MRLAVYNVENLFDRPKVMNQATWAEGRKVLEQFGALSRLLGQQDYSAADKRRMVELLTALGLARGDESKFVILRRNHGGLLKRPRAGGLEITADGRADWVGSLELKEEPIDEVPVRNTARVIVDLNADILGVVEAESRPALREFNRVMIKAQGGALFRHIMLVDGNDTRGIDVGLMTRDGFPIGAIRSHVDDPMPGGAGNVFSRDCPEYDIALPGGRRLVVMLNHFKSKGHGTQADNDAKRKAQATRVKEIYEARLAAGDELIAVMGDFNDAPGSAPLAPLLDDTNLKDIFEHPQFDNGGHEGTFGGAKKAEKFDYLLLSPALFALVEKGGVWRKGMWPGVRPVKWDAYPEIARPNDAASDHAAVWADIGL